MSYTPVGVPSVKPPVMTSSFGKSSTLDAPDAVILPLQYTKSLAISEISGAVPILRLVAVAGTKPLVLPRLMPVATAVDAAGSAQDVSTLSGNSYLTPAEFTVMPCEIV